MTRIGPVVKWKCQFCNWEAEGPWIYTVSYTHLTLPTTPYV